MSAATDDARLNNAVVVVIEDDAMQLMAMQMLLESWGCGVIPAASARAAETALAAAAAQPTLIISDFRLPENISGIQAVARLQTALGRPVPAILQTGDTDPALVREATDHGYTILHKPYDPGQLRHLMVSLLSA